MGSELNNTLTLTNTYFTALVKQLGEKHDLPVKSAYNSTRGFHAQMHLNNQDNVTIEDLPSQFIKVVKTKNVLAFTTADLVSLYAAMIYTCII